LTTKENILNLIRSHKAELSRYGIQNIGLFGSYIHDLQTSGSDIDILIDFSPESENFDNLMSVCDNFENLFKNEKVEIVTKNLLSPYIGPLILKEFVYA
jgi:predicted nucleotidyltransferase